MSHGRAGGLGRGRSAPQDLLVELARLGFWLDAELPSKRVNTALILPEGSVTPAVAHVEPHQGAVDRLLERIQRQQAESRRDGSAGLFRLCLVGEQFGQGLEGELTQPLPLRDQPLLERRLGDPQAFQQVPAIQVDRLLEGFGIGPAGKPLEREDVDVERGSVQRHGVLVEAQARRDDGKPPAKDEQHLAEIGTRLPVVHLRPEQRGELLPWMRLVRVAGEIGQERLGLFKPDRHGLAGSSLEVEAAEQTQLQSRHHAENTSLFSARSRQGTHPGTPGTTPWERPRRTRVAWANRSWPERSNHQDATNPVEKEHNMVVSKQSLAARRPPLLTPAADGSSVTRRQTMIFSPHEHFDNAPVANEHIDVRPLAA